MPALEYYFRSCSKTVPGPLLPCRTSSTCCAVGRGTGELLRQAAMRSATSCGHSSGTLPPPQPMSSMFPSMHLGLGFPRQLRDQSPAAHLSVRSFLDKFCLCIYSKHAPHSHCNGRACSAAAHRWVPRGKVPRDAQCSAILWHVVQMACLKAARKSYSETV